MSALPNTWIVFFCSVGLTGWGYWLVRSFRRDVNFAAKQYRDGGLNAALDALGLEEDLNDDAQPEESPVADEGRNIVLCFDGTGDWIGSDFTNVAKIFTNLEKSDRQLCFYDGGIGTLSDPTALTTFQRTFLQLLDLAVGTGLRGKVLVGYDFLVQNYRPGDKIFLFGFSRGAYTARVLAGMILNFGLLTKECAHLSGYLWQTCTGITRIRSFKKTAQRIQASFGSGPVNIQFMGLFDTVSSIGVLSRFKTYPNTDQNPAVKRICHAVSIDEQRNGFPESLIYPAQKGLTEVWFPGVHRDVGGGLPDGFSRIADEALYWIQGEATANGLALKNACLPDRNMAPIPNYSDYDPYAFLGFYPMKIFNKAVSQFRILWPNFRHERVVPDYALVHEIAFVLKNTPGSNYDPVNWPEHPTPFRTGESMKGPERYILPTARLNLADCVGITLGVALLILVWNWLSDSPFGPSWPDVDVIGVPVWGWLLIFFAAFFLCQFVGQKFTDKLPRSLRPRSDGILPWIGGALGVAVLALSLVWSWNTLWFGIGAGLIASLVGQAAPRPAMPADRVLPYALQSAVASGALFVLAEQFDEFDRILPEWRWVPAFAILLVCAAYAGRQIFRDRVIMAEENEKSQSAGEMMAARRHSPS